jgi:group I intron endonuclease
MVKNISIYTLSDPDTNLVRYVGVSENVDRRFKEHMTEKRHNTYRLNWINKLKRSNKEPIMEIIEDNLTMNAAFELEIHYIKLFKSLGAKLTNLTIGGEAPMMNKKHTDLTKEKMSEDRTGEKNSFFGKTHTEESRSKMSKSSQHTSHRKGTKHTDDTCEKMRLTKYNNGQTKINIELMFRLKQQGLSNIKIANILGSNRITIGRYLIIYKNN